MVEVGEEEVRQEGEERPDDGAAHARERPQAGERSEDAAGARHAALRLEEVAEREELEPRDRAEFEPIA